MSTIDANTWEKLQKSKHSCLNLQGLNLTAAPDAALNSLITFLLHQTVGRTIQELQLVRRRVSIFIQNHRSTEASIKKNTVLKG